VQPDGAITDVGRNTKLVCIRLNALESALHGSVSKYICRTRRATSANRIFDGPSGRSLFLFSLTTKPNVRFQKQKLGSFGRPRVVLFYGVWFYFGWFS
jgi:hypothetical protein